MDIFYVALGFSRGLVLLVWVGGGRLKRVLCGAVTPRLTVMACRLEKLCIHLPKGRK